MKTFFRILLIGWLGGMSFDAFDAAATLEVGASVQIKARTDFDAPLAAHGTWVEVHSLGRCWHPVGVAVEWRPYCYGHWIWTDCGWYWESDEPWAWACYHYGYWAYDADFGWVWVPDIEWGPAWVSWRVGGGYIGWAPLPPPGFVSVRVTAPTLFVFVETRHFVEPIRPSRVIVNNTTIINQTTVINNVRRENRTFDGGTSQRVVINEGPGVDPIQKATGKTVSRESIRSVVRQTPAPTTLKPEPLQPTGREKPPAVKEQPQSTPAQKQPPGRVSEPGRDQTTPPSAPSKPDVTPPDRPATPTAPPATRPGPSHGRGQGTDKERGRGHDKDQP